MSVYVLGASHTRFGEHWEKSYRDLMTEAGLGALNDARIPGEDIDAVFVGSMSTGKFLGQEHIAPLLLDGAGLGDLNIPATRVEAAGASGGVALRAGIQAIKSGEANIVVVGGVEKMTDVSDHDAQAISCAGIDQEWEHFVGATDAALHALMTKAHMRKYGTTREQLAAVAVKNHAHAAGNPLAQFQREITEEMVLRSPVVADPLTMFDCAPLSDGAACVILCDEDTAMAADRGTKISGSGQASDSLSVHGRKDRTMLRATEVAALRAYAQAGISAADVNLAEVHDGFTIQEVMAIEDLGLVKRGTGGLATAQGRTSFEGSVVVNPSGGLKARGHPAGATGIAQICELSWQLRGEAKGRQVEDALIGVAHNTGGTGATAVVHVMEAMQ